MKLLILNGPNLNMLGIREPEIYGKQSYRDLEDYIRTEAKGLGCEVEIRQSNHEGDLVDWIQQAYGKFDGIVINPAAYTHTSVAILDALKAVRLPAVEVHLSDIDTREPFRRISYAGLACRKTFQGHGFAGYRMAMEFLISAVR
ncbi:MAG: type II 3-dehydroquinate dehydratase [Clostridiales bacterium]|nr:type II 3-dehydroquinate dehydratase [Clostridiales bacterium]